MKNWRWFLLAGALLVGAPAFAESWPPDSVRYVRADADGGNNGRGNTAATAWTLAEACAQATAGYTVLIGPGNYTSTALNPSNSGMSRDEAVPWVGNHGRIRFVGNTSNAQACSVSSITINKPYITVMGVSTKVGGSVMLGARDDAGPKPSSPTGSWISSSDATFDSLAYVYVKRTSSALLLGGVQNSVVARCSLFNSSGSTSNRALTMTSDYGQENSCARPLFNATSAARVCQFDTLIANYFHSEKVRRGERKFFLGDHTSYSYFSGNSFVAYGDSTLPTGNNSGETLIFVELARAYNNVFVSNGYYFDTNFNFGYAYGMAMRDSAVGNTFDRDVVYAGLDVNGRGGVFANYHPISWTMGQSGQPCPVDCGKSFAGSVPCEPLVGAFYTTFRRGRYFLTGSFTHRDFSRQTTIDSSLIVTKNNVGLNLGDSPLPGFLFTNNTVMTFGGKRVVERRNGSVGTFKYNILVCDSLMAKGDCTSNADVTGGGLFWNGISNGSVNYNLYWARTGQFSSVYRAVRDSLIKWRWSGYYPPDTTKGGGSCQSGDYWRLTNDGNSKYGNPSILGYGFSTSNTGRPTNSALVYSVAGSGRYVGALMPVDTVGPSVPSSFTASSDALFNKTITWIESGDDSTFFNAESVFVCERSDHPDSSRIDSTNYPSWVMVGLPGSEPGSLMTLRCTVGGSVTVNDIEIEPDEYLGAGWSGYGSDALFPGNVIGWVRIVVKDKDGNLSFSTTLQLVAS